MATITYKGVQRVCAPGETVLDCLRRHGVEVHASCRAGVCQSCVLRAVDGAPPPSSQAGLSEPLRRSGHFLACVAVPRSDVEVAPPGAALSSTRAAVIEKTMLAPDIVRLRLHPIDAFDFKGGQFVQIVRADGLVRSFSLASVAKEGFLELHVRRVRGGQMSEWLHDSLALDDVVVVRGPAGECFYAPELDKAQPLLLAGTGTGAAPLWAVLKDALAHGHRGLVHFFHGVRRRSDLYLDDALRAVERVHANVRYHAVIASGFVVDTAIDDTVLSTVPAPAGFRVTLCGAPDVVARLSRRLYLAGARLEDISSDPFVASRPDPGPARDAKGG